MNIKDINICMISPEGDHTAFEFARKFAAAHEAHLSCTAITVLPQTEIGYEDVAGAELYLKLIQEARVSMGAAWHRFEENLKNEPTIEVRRCEAMQNRIDALCAMNARHADLVIVRAPSTDDKQLHTDMLEGVLLGGGRPVLMLPEDWTNEKIGLRTVIGWDASREATRALHDGLPLIPKEADVCLVTVDAKPGDMRYGAAPGWDIGTHLAHHVRNVEVRNEDSIGRSTAAALLDVAASFNADLMVLGGYRHSRLEQVLLPSVTRTILREIKMPLLLSH